MAVVYSTFIRAKTHAKANIRYIQHRAGKDGQKLTRELFGHNGSITRKDAYSMIDRAKRGAYFYRISLNPDQRREDRENDLDLRQLTRETMRAVEKQFNRPIEFIAAIHADHTVRRHVNLLALLPKRLNKDTLTLLRQALTQEAKVQRTELDQGIPWQWERTRRLSQAVSHRVRNRIHQQSRVTPPSGGGGRPKKNSSLKTHRCLVCGAANCTLHPRNNASVFERERTRQ